MKKSSTKRKTTDGVEILWRQFVAGDSKMEALVESEVERIRKAQAKIVERERARARASRILQVKKFAAEIGGLKTLKEIVDSLSK
jgi:hypothetical protein